MPDSNRKQGIFYEIHVSLPAGDRHSFARVCGVPLQAAENMTEQSTPDESAATAENHEETMVITAARQNLQVPGVSTITAEEIRKHPPARDVSELIRTQPGGKPDRQLHQRAARQQPAN